MEAEHGQVGPGGDLSDSHDSSAGLSRAAPLYPVIQISMPNFNEKEDLVESFLPHFEKLAMIHRVPKEHWAMCQPFFWDQPERYTIT